MHPSSAAHSILYAAEAGVAPEQIEPAVSEAIARGLAAAAWFRAGAGVRMSGHRADQWRAA
jgi:hypothetical protein